MRKLVIYHDGYHWNGAVEFTTGRWFKQTQHAPITHADSATEVFAWLIERYPNDTISLEPSLSERYNLKAEAC